jgi:hypothetical protein
MMAAASGGGGAFFEHGGNMAIASRAAPVQFFGKPRYPDDFSAPTAPMVCPCRRAYRYDHFSKERLPWGLCNEDLP